MQVWPRLNLGSCEEAQRSHCLGNRTAAAVTVTASLALMGDPEGHMESAYLPLSGNLSPLQWKFAAREFLMNSKNSRIGPLSILAA